MMRGVSFNGQHCFNDLGMVLSSKSIGLPEVQTNYVQIPGRDGRIDLSTALTGEIKFYDRIITLVFETCDNISKSNWASFLSKIARLLHGQQVQIIFDDDKEFYYIGRAQINQFETTQQLQTITVECNCDPYKYDIEPPGTPWLWDPFSFVDGVIYAVEIEVNGESTEEYINRSKRVTPTFICSDAMTVIYDGKEYALRAGSNVIYEITFDPNETTTLTFVGYGTVSVRYEVGVL